MFTLSVLNPATNNPELLVLFVRLEPVFIVRLAPNVTMPLYAKSNVAVEPTMTDPLPRPLAWLTLKIPLLTVVVPV